MVRQKSGQVFMLSSWGCSRVEKWSLMDWGAKKGAMYLVGRAEKM